MLRRWGTVMSNRTRQISFSGVIDGNFSLYFEKKIQWVESGMLLVADVGTKEEFRKNFPHKLELKLTINHKDSIPPESTLLEICKQLPKKQYNLVSVHKPTDHSKLELLYEWISHHLNIGVEHFVLYSREEQYPPEVQHLIDADIITWLYLPKFANFSWRNMDQEIIYKHYVMQNRNYVKWIMVHDPDEFLVTVGWQSFRDALDVLRNEPIIEIPRVRFSSATPQPGQFQIEKWLQRESLEFWDECKVIEQPRCTWWTGVHHSYAQGYYNLRYDLNTRNRKKKPILQIPPHQMRWHHYRKMFGEQDFGIQRPVTDQSALFYLPSLNETYWKVEQCAKGDNLQCTNLKHIRPVFILPVVDPIPVQ